MREIRPLAPQASLLTTHIGLFRYSENGRLSRPKAQNRRALYEIRKWVDCDPPGAYSYLNASIGFSRDAFRAGKNPETTPTMERMVNEMIITPMEACRKIAPSWSAVL